MRRYIIADIRGDLFLLQKLIERIGPTYSDSLIFLGSYLGPGNESKGVVDYLINLRKTFPNMSFLKGCYEYMFGLCIESKPSWECQRLWGEMGGSRVFKSYADDQKLIAMTDAGPRSVEIPLKIPASHIEFIAGDLFQWYEDDLFPIVACHAGGHPVLYGGKLETEQQIVFAENGWWKQEGRFIPDKTVVFSHVPFAHPFRGKGKLGIDLGAGIGGKLCAYEMVSDSFIIVR